MMSSCWWLKHQSFSHVAYSTSPHYGHWSFLNGAGRIHGQDLVPQQGHLWSSMVFYGHLWSSMVIYGTLHATVIESQLNKLNSRSFFSIGLHFCTCTHNYMSTTAPLMPEVHGPLVQPSPAEQPAVALGFPCQLRMK